MGIIIEKQKAQADKNARHFSYPLKNKMLVLYRDRTDELKKGMKTHNINEKYTSLPTLSEFVKTLHSYYKTNTDRAEFVCILFDNILDDFSENAKDNTAEQKEYQSYNPLRNTDRFASSTILRYYSRNQISPDTYRQMLKYLNVANFECFMEKCDNPTEEDERALVAFIKQYDAKATAENYFEKYASIFEAIIQRGAAEPRKKAGRKKQIGYPEETSKKSMDDLEERIIKVVNAVSKSINAEKDPDDPKIVPLICKKVKKNYGLRKQILNDLLYFDVIKNAFCAAQENGGKPNSFICNSVHLKYLKLKEKTNDEEEIFKGMEVYFASFAGVEPYCEEVHAIVSYFVQLCEVFDAPA